MSLIAFAGAAQFAAIGYVVAGDLLAGHRAPDVPPECPPRCCTPRPSRRGSPGTPFAARAGGGPPAHRRGVRPRHRRTSGGSGGSTRSGYWFAAIVATLIPWNLATLAGVTLGASIVDPTAARHRRDLPRGDGRAGVGPDHRPARAGRGGRQARRSASACHWRSARQPGVIAGGVLRPVRRAARPGGAKRARRPRSGTEASARRYSMPGTSSGDGGADAAELDAETAPR